MSGHDDRIARLVEEHRWAVIRVPEDDVGPGFAYTIGLHRRYGHPEIIMFGLDGEMMQHTLNDLGEAIASGGRFEAGSTSDQVLEGYPVAFRAVSTGAYGEYLGAAMRFYGREPFPTVQCVWPDRQGRFPWNAGVAPEYARLQPALWADRRD